MIAKLTAATAGNYYYEKDPFFNKEENNNEQNLTIKGETAKELGIFGDEAEKEKFENLLDGRSDDNELRYKDKVQSGNERVGYDMVFSAPKSVSHAALVLDQKDIIEAHKQAVDVAMKELEKHAGARVKNEEGDREFVKTGNILYAQATHSTSRPTSDNKPDPSLHTHNIIFNTTKTEKGDYRALNTDEIYKNQNLIMNTYKQELAYNLKQKGYDLEFDKKGNFEIKGYEETTLKHFSKRSQEIHNKAEEMKTDERYSHISDSRAKNFAQHEFKKDKKEYTKEELKNDWDRQHKELNIQDKEELLNNIKNQKENKDERINSSQFKSVDEVFKLASENLMDKKSHVSEAELIKEVYKISEANLKHDEIKDKINNIKEEGQINKSDLKKITVNGETRYTNKDIYDTEKEIEKILSNSSKKSTNSLLTKKQAEEGLDSFEKMKGWKLSETQREASMLILTTKDQYTSIQGDAGVGKTAMLEAINHAYSQTYTKSKANKELGVLAPTGKAAAGAEAESGIKGMTIDSFLIKGKFDKSEQESSVYKSSFNKKEFPSSKEGLQIGGGKFGLKITKDFDFIRVEKSIKEDKMFNKKETYTKEEIKTGEQKGAVKTTKSKKNGDSYERESTIKFKDGSTIESTFKAYSPSPGFSYTNSITKNSETSLYNQKKEVKALGFSYSYKRTAFKDENNEIKNLNIETKISFLGLDLKKTNFEADKKEYYQTISTKQEDGTYKKETSSSNNSSHNLNSINKKFDKQVSNLEQEGNKEKMIFIDEASMSSSKKTLELLKKAEESGTKIAFIGDTKQIQSVQQGRSFEVIQKHTKSVHMNQANRQKNKELKDIVDTFARGEAIESVKKLDNAGKLKEMNKDEAIDYIASKISEKNKDGKFNFSDTLTIAATKKDVEEINKKTREKAFGSADFGEKVSVVKDKGLDLVDKTKISNYSVDDKIVLKEKQGDKEKTTNWNIKEKNGDNLVLTSEDKKSEKTINVKKDYKDIQQVASVEKIGLTAGDKVIKTKNDKDIKNGEIGFVTKIEKGNLHVKFNNKEKDTVYKIDDNKPLDLTHGHAMTIHKSQGMTEDKTIAYLSADSMLNKNLGYVAFSRPKHELEVITDDKKKFVNKIAEKQIKESTSDSYKIEKTDNKVEQKEETKSSYKIFEEQKQKIDKDIDKTADKIEYLKKIDKEGDKTKNLINSFEKEIDKLKEKKNELIENFNKDVSKEFEKRKEQDVKFENKTDKTSDDKQETKSNDKLEKPSNDKSDNIYEAKSNEKSEDKLDKKSDIKNDDKTDKVEIKQETKSSDKSDKEIINEKSEDKLEKKSDIKNDDKTDKVEIKEEVKSNDKNIDKSSNDKSEETKDTKLQS
jgi:conjugative relaxase-like TrwC/TraI family protein